MSVSTHVQRHAKVLFAALLAAVALLAVSAQSSQAYLQYFDCGNQRLEAYANGYCYNTSVQQGWAHSTSSTNVNTTSSVCVSMFDLSLAQKYFWNCDNGGSGQAYIFVNESSYVGGRNNTGSAHYVRVSGYREQP